MAEVVTPVKGEEHIPAGRGTASVVIPRITTEAVGAGSPRGEPGIQCPESEVRQVGS